MGEARQQAVTRSLGDVLDANRGMGPGFDALRVLLALVVMFIHSVPLTVGAAAFDYRGTWLQVWIQAVLPMFFGLSGFLVTGSAQRLNHSARFALHRGARIIPALTVEVVLSAVILGGLLTTLPAAGYFSQAGFWSYFGNIVGLIQFELPGVFASNPFPHTVNGSLWTLKPEYYCYLILLGAMVLGVFKRRTLYLGVLGLGGLVCIAADVVLKFGSPEYHYPSSVLVFAFLAGSGLYLVSHSVSSHPAWALVSVAAYVLLAKYSPVAYGAVLPLVYLICWLGMRRIPLPALFKRGDYSYGIYLYAFPIQQTLVEAVPAIRQSWLLLFVVSALLTTVFAVFSWHAIEKPALRLKNLF